MLKTILGVILLMKIAILQALPSVNEITFEIIPASQQYTVFPLLKKMRVENYSLFPYLYVSEGETTEDVTSYEQSQNVLIVIARKGEHIEALVATLPLADVYNKTLDITAKKLFENTLKNNIESFYYISDLLFADPKQSDEYKEEIAQHLIQFIENDIKHNKSFEQVCMLVVERPKNHPLSQELFLDEAKILTKLGYTKTHYKAQMSWNVRINNNTNEKQENTLILWSKKSENISSVSK